MMDLDLDTAVRFRLDERRSEAERERLAALGRAARRVVAARGRLAARIVAPIAAHLRPSDVRP